MSTTEKFLKMAIELARKNVVEDHGRPFGAVLVKDGNILATGVNEIGKTKDPTDHAELSVIRRASRLLKSPRLDGCVIYASGNPCPMCLAAMYMTGIKEVYFGYSNQEGEQYGLSTASVYKELMKPFSEQSMSIHHHPVKTDGELIYDVWKKMS